MAGSAVAVVAAGMTALGISTVSASEAAPQYQPQASDFYVNYAPPMVEKDSHGAEVKDENGVYRPRFDDLAFAIDRKFSKGNPRAAKQLAKLESEAIRTGKNPRQIKEARGTQVAKLLTLLVEFNENANDDFSGFRHPKTTGDVNDCVTEPAGTLLSGPLHNEIPDPAKAPIKDNNTLWLPDFSPGHYNKMLYSKDGVTERARTDLTGPDGKPGVSLAGYTMRNLYEEMSKGAYTVDGEAVGWLKVPHSEAWYGAARCGTYPQENAGHPDNPRGVQQLAIDAVDVLTRQRPDFPWADYDREDPGDADGDGNYVEPDGIVDHLVLVHAGRGKSTGGGAQGTYAIWAHASTVLPGYTVPGTSIKISNYIINPEDSGVGVFAHEYGHDLGLPDLYDISASGDSDVAFWDLMDAGPLTGPLSQTIPSHMGLWDKFVLGWADPVTLNPGDSAQAVQLGQSARTPVGTRDGIRVNLPPKKFTTATPHGGQAMWYSGADQDWADVKVTRSLTVPNGSDVRFWTWNNYVAEADWDYGFVEVSTDGGQTWSEQKVYDSAGALVSTGDGYTDPNGRMKDYGGKKYGLTGTSNGWRHDYVDLTPYAGTSISLRLRYATDAGFLESGWYADDFSVTAGGTTVWSDGVESGANGWTATTGSWTDTTGKGWQMTSGTETKAHYYLAEWRNTVGFDEGLNHTYDTSYLRDGAWKVEKARYNAPGMLVWYRDTVYGTSQAVGSGLTALPSSGPKGGLLIVDSHFDPMRRAGTAAAKDPSLLDNLPGRAQAGNAAFSLQPTKPFRECYEAAGEPFSEYCTDIPAEPPVPTFTDAKGWYPGLEHRNGLLHWRDYDASVTVASKDGKRYSTRIVEQDGTPIAAWYGTDYGWALLGSGNPADHGAALGVSMTVRQAAKDNSYAVVYVTPPPAG